MVDRYENYTSKYTQGLEAEKEEWMAGAEERERAFSETSEISPEDQKRWNEEQEMELDAIERNLSAAREADKEYATKMRAAASAVRTDERTGTGSIWTPDGGTIVHPGFNEIPTGEFGKWEKSWRSASDGDLASGKRINLEGSMEYALGRASNAADVLADQDNLIRERALPNTSANYEGPTPYLGDFDAPAARHTPVFLDLIRRESVTNMRVDWDLLTTVTDGAVGKAEGAALSSSEYNWTNAEIELIPYGTWTSVTMASLMATGDIEGKLRNLLRGGVRRQIGKDIILGNGSGSNPAGFADTTTWSNIPKSGALTLTADATRGVAVADELEKGLTSVENNGETEPNAIAIHFDVRSWLRTAKAGTSDNSYVIRNPEMAGLDTLWGKPLIPTSDFGALANNKTFAIVGDFSNFIMLTLGDFVADMNRDGAGAAQDYQKLIVGMRVFTFLEFVITNQLAFYTVDGTVS